MRNLHVDSVLKPHHRHLLNVDNVARTNLLTYFWLIAVYLDGCNLFYSFQINRQALLRTDFSGYVNSLQY